ncbi:MAG: UMP kinase [bacterium]|nr:UMP kinase [bacterium]
MDNGPCYQRILLKLSGESLKGDRPFGISEEIITDIAAQIREIHQLGVQVAIVSGGGNFFRGVRSNTLGIDRVSADYMGMLATVINGIALRDVLEKEGLHARLVSALEIKAVAEPFIRRRAVGHLEKGRIVIFSSGTGNPFFTTDTAAALRAIEVKADILLKATMVSGVYSDDPKKVKNTVRYDHISYQEVLTRELKILDSTAVTLCKENNLPIKIFDITKPGNIVKAILDKDIGTTVGEHRE